jgi:hypothetical protein
MRMKILCAGLLALPVAAAAQVTPIGPFTGDRQDGWTVGEHPTFECPPCFYPCLPDGAFQGAATVCVEGGGSAHITGGWGFGCSISSHLTPRIYGNTGGNTVFEFGEPVSMFGGYFGTNNPTIGDGEVEFYDETGALISTQPGTWPNDCTWTWNGWESTVPIAKIRIVGFYTGGHVMLDDMEMTFAVTGGCYPDCDESGELDFFDFLCFQNAFAAGDPYADCDGSGSLDFFDFLCFQNEFAAGCP